MARQPADVPRPGFGALQFARRGADASRAMRRPIMLLICVVAAVAVAVPALAQDPPPSESATTVPAAAANLIPGLDDAIVGLPLEGDGAGILARLGEIDLRRVEIVLQLGEVGDRRAKLDLILDALDEQEERHARELVAAERQLAQATAAAYKTAGSLGQISTALDTENIDDLARGLKLSTKSAERLLNLAHEAEGARRRAGAASRKVAEEVLANDTRERRLQGDLEAVQGDWRDALDAAMGTEGSLVIRDTDLPLVVLNAYVRAARGAAWLEPECRVPWWALAGIGKVESNHGRFRGAVVDLEGNTDPKIFGVPLDGSPGIALIGDTDGGLLDEDPILDRAVGPMQFIPSTWVRWAHDGNGDELEDPHNIYDAAMSAAMYLCASAPAEGLVGDEPLIRAFLSYNHSLEYAAKVLALAHEYQAAIGELPAP